MNKINNIQDEFLKKLIGKSDLDQPSADFTQKIMQKIQPDLLLEKKKSIFNANNLSWILLSGAAITIAILIIFADFTFISTLLDNINIRNMELVSFLSGIMNSFSSAFKTVQFSSLSVLIIFSGISLFILDRLIRKIRATHFFLI